MIHLLLALVGDARAEDIEYRVGVGDTVRVDVYDEPDLSREMVVPSACRIEVNLIGTVEVCGRTTPELKEHIRGRLADGYVKEPIVFVDVTAHGAMKVEVSGAVHDPGIQVLTGPTSLWEIIVDAGGAQDDSVMEVEIITPGGDARSYLLAELAVGAPVMINGGERVIVKSGRHVFIGGAVMKGGRVAYFQGMTARDALMLAGGPGDYATLRRAYIVRADGSRIEVNLKKIAEGRAADVEMLPDDQLTIRAGVVF